MGRGSEAHRFGVGPWRAPGANMNVWARESQIDVMAAALGVDPLARDEVHSRLPHLARAAYPVEIVHKHT